MILFGASGHSKVIIDILRSRNIKIDYILDDNPQFDSISNIKVFKNNLGLNASMDCIISIGDNKTRKKITDRFPRLNYKSILHINSNVSENVIIGAGSVVMQGACINPSARIGNHCIINTGAVVEHDCVLEDFVHISPNAAIAGSVKVGEGSQVGIGASIIQGVNIGKWVIIGAGSVITKDIPDNCTVVGVPGKIIKFDNE